MGSLFVKLSNEISFVFWFYSYTGLTWCAEKTRTLIKNFVLESKKKNCKSSKLGRQSIVIFANEQFTRKFSSFQNGQAPKTLLGGEGLLKALSYRHASLVKALIDAGRPINWCNQNGESALLLAAKYCEDIAVLKVLIAERADVNRPDANMTAPVHWASIHGRADVVQVLLQGRASVDIRDSLGSTALHWAVRSGYVEVMHALIAAQSDVNTQDTAGNTPLHWAIKRGFSSEMPVPRLHLAQPAVQKQIILELLAAGASLEIKNDLEQTALGQAAASVDDHCDLVEVLFDAGAKVNVQDSQGNTPLHLATVHGTREMVQLLSTRYEVRNVQNVKGSTALHEASKLGFIEKAMTLLFFKAAVDINDREGCTALHEAARNGPGETVRILLDSGSNANLQSKDGRSALHWGVELCGDQMRQAVALGMSLGMGMENNEGFAALHQLADLGSSAIVKTILGANGLDINLQDNKGYTALHQAAENGYHKVVELLLEAGADIQLVDNQGSTALHVAASKGFSKVAQAISGEAQVNT